jgi:3-phenylpropionate/cinnamic acid dioxygenase small subunit
MENPRALPAKDRIEIQDLLFRFMRSFDEKDWEAMGECLAQTLDCDYSSFRSTAPGKMTRDSYVKQRRAALSSLRTQHNLSNVTMSKSGGGIEVRCNYAILRFHPGFDGSRDGYFHSYGQYRFIVSRRKRRWYIASIAQSLLMNNGNPALHGGLKR